LNKTTITVPFERITNTFTKEGLEERLFDVGGVYITTAGTDARETVLEGVSAPARFKVELEELYLEMQDEDPSYTYS